MSGPFPSSHDASDAHDVRSVITGILAGHDSDPARVQRCLEGWLAHDRHLENSRAARALCVAVILIDGPSSQECGRLLTDFVRSTSRIEAAALKTEELVGLCHHFSQVLRCEHRVDELARLLNRAGTEQHLGTAHDPGDFNLLFMATNFRRDPASQPNER